MLAIAATLLVLQLDAGQGRGSLAHQLSVQWPTFLSYFISFLNIGVIWLNHHRVVARFSRVDHPFLVINLVLLVIVSLLPFPTRLIGDELAGGTNADQRTAALLYTGNFVLASVAFYALWLWATKGGRLIKPGVPCHLNRMRTLRFGLAIPAFAVPFGLSFLSPIAGLAGDGVIMATFLLSDAATERLVMRLAGR